MTGIDLRTQLLPDDLTLSLLWLGLAASLFPLFVSPQQAIAGALVGYLSLYAVYRAYKAFTGVAGMGGGDFKLLAALGAWLGPKPLLLLVLLASISGTIAGLVFLAIRRKSLPFAFGPYLAVAGWIMLLWGAPLMDWLLPSIGDGQS
jgi:leader peptidase (prepilin peptidase) / N-methyltransferase